MISTKQLLNFEFLMESFPFIQLESTERHCAAVNFFAPAGTTSVCQQLQRALVRKMYLIGCVPSAQIETAL